MRRSYQLESFMCLPGLIPDARMLRPLISRRTHCTYIYCTRYGGNSTTSFVLFNTKKRGKKQEQLKSRKLYLLFLLFGFRKKRCSSGIALFSSLEVCLRNGKNEGLFTFLCANRCREVGPKARN